MPDTSLTTFTDSLTLLRQALADADPLATPPEAVLFATTAETVAATFAGASESVRAHFLLRALDDAIAAVEIAARLADEFNGGIPVSDESATDTATTTTGLAAAYHAFTESQPAYQELYHYRNALAAHLRLETRPIPEAVQPATDETLAQAADETSQAPKPRRRSRKKADDAAH